MKMDSGNIIAKIAYDICGLQSPTIIEVEKRYLTEQQLQNEIANLGCFVTRIEQSPKDKKELLQSLDKACNFPDYFGFNWDALADCLADFHWKSAKGYVFIYEDPQKLNSLDLDTFLSIVQETGADWVREGIPFKLLVPKGSLGII